MTWKSRIYPAFALCMAVLALLYAVNFIADHRPPPSLLTDVDIGNFEQVVLDAKTPVFIEFYKRGCQPCNQEFSTLNKLVGEYQGRVLFVRIDMDRNAALAEALHIAVAPTHVIFNPQTAMGKAKLGYADEATLRALIDDGLQPPAPPPAPSIQPPSTNSTPTGTQPAAPSTNSTSTGAHQQAPATQMPSKGTHQKTPMTPPPASKSEFWPLIGNHADTLADRLSARMSITFVQ